MIYEKPSNSLCAHIESTQKMIAAVMQKPLKTKKELEDDAGEEFGEFQEAWDEFSAQLAQLALVQDAISSEMLHEAVRLYLELAQEAADVVYKGVGCFLAEAPEYWQMAQNLLDGRVSLDVAIRAYIAKYGRRSVGLRKSPQERVLMASCLTPTDLALPYEINNEGLWTPKNWQPYSIRDAGDLRLTLKGVRRPLAFINLDGFVRDSEPRFQLARVQRKSPFSPELFTLDQIYPGVREGLAEIEEYYSLVFISTTKTDQAVDRSNVEWLDNQSIWSQKRRLILRPAHVMMSGTEWKAEIIWQEIQRLAPPVVILGDDRQQTQEYVLEQSLLEVLGPTPHIRTASTLAELAVLGKKLML